MIVFEDLVRATLESGATIESISDDAVVLELPAGLAPFAMALAARNTEWEEEATYFVDSASRVGGSDSYRFEYVVSYPEGEGDYSNLETLVATIASEEYA